MSKEAFDKINKGLRDAIVGSFTRVYIDGVTWVRADSGSPDEELMLCRQRVAELTTKIDVLASEHIDEIERLSISIRGLDEQRLQEKGLWENEERRLNAENKALREALERIKAPGYGLELSDDDAYQAEYWAKECETLRNIARAVLKTTGGEG